MDWTGPWVSTNGNGPLMISVPTPEDPGVTVTRDFPESAAAGAPAHPVTPPPAHDGPGAPPPTRTGTPTGSPAVSTGVGVPPPRPSRAPDGDGLQAYGYRAGPGDGGNTGGSGTTTTRDTSVIVEPAAQPEILGWTTDLPAEKSRGHY